MISQDGMKAVGHYKCYLAQESADITAKQFKVYIPELMQMSKNTFNNKEGDKKLSVNRNLSSQKTNSLNQNLNSANYIIAKSMTDYRTYHFGQVFETSGTEHTTEETVVEEQIADNHKHQHDPHVHEMKKPIKIFDMKYEDLNKVTIKRGHEMIGVFINGDFNDFRIVHIVGVIPQDRDGNSNGNTNGNTSK